MVQRFTFYGHTMAMDADSLQIWMWILTYVGNFSCLLMLLLYKLHSSIYAGEILCYSHSNCTQTMQNTTTQVPTMALPLTITVVAVIAAVLGVILLVLLVVCTVALVVCLKRKQGRMKREVIGNL